MATPNLWINSASVGLVAYIPSESERAADADTHHHMAVGASATVHTRQGASEHQVSVNFNGTTVILPRKSEDFKSFSRPAQETLLGQCEPGGAIDRLLRFLVARDHDFMLRHPSVTNFSWQWTPTINDAWNDYHSARSCGWVVWSPNGPDYVKFNVVRADGTFQDWSLEGAFTHPRGVGVRVGLSGGGMLADFWRDLQLPAGPARWKNRLRDDLVAVQGVIAEFARAKQNCGL